jgi:hypothetical protein
MPVSRQGFFIENNEIGGSTEWRHFQCHSIFLGMSGAGTNGPRVDWSRSARSGILLLSRSLQKRDSILGAVYASRTSILNAGNASKRIVFGT